ncbi:Na+-translocating ferredoxin:NAD+ oxidoreductase RnfG subunit [Gelidibacter sediminis]|uniref:Na+-translocating ferredoxin:NAD+ oxidoreductase RnfG subunit n=1 Tax=Gelidibacter sediminis TaxID=1608710 RepID=A0A4R7PZM8_9FLAO|nr:FMN-binding protein [Gelidibacter sediminis]TDU39621.1 Na+-translocating ferredoxin:NAD+ oxidoreductase RnfG subunit [Gelidibacter sediminis]
MNLKFTIIIFILTAFQNVELPKHIQKKVDKEISETFQSTATQFETFKIPQDVAKGLPSTFGSDNFFKIRHNNKLLGYAYIAKAPSKTDEFDYLVLLNPDLVVLSTKVLVYREDYGGEIGSKRWLRQFIGKSLKDELRYGDNIMAISGATISVRSMTSAMNDLLKSLKILHSKNII